MAERVLGIDPGYDKLGVAVVEQKETGQTTLLFSDCVRPAPKKDFAERLFAVGQTIEKLITEYRPRAVALEKVFFANNQKTALQIGAVRGVILYLSKLANLVVAEYTPLQVKMDLTGYGRAGKTQIAIMVGKLIAISKIIKDDDEYDAIAIALTHLARHPLTRAIYPQKH